MGLGLRSDCLEIVFIYFIPLFTNILYRDEPRESLRADRENQGAKS